VFICMLVETLIIGHNIIFNTTYNTINVGHNLLAIIYIYIYIYSIYLSSSNKQTNLLQLI